MRKRFRVDAAFAPVAQHHRRGGTAAQGFGLRDERDVENAERGRPSLRGAGARKRDQHQQAEPDEARAAVMRDGRGWITSGQSIATTSKMMTRSAMMIIVVEMTTRD